MKEKIHKSGIVRIAALLFVFFNSGAVIAAATPTPLNLKVRADQLLKQGRIGQAIPLYERVLRLDAKFANVYYNLATAYYLQNEVNKAAENLEAFTRLQPDDAEALFNLGCLKLQRGNFKEACKCFLRAQDCPCSQLISREIKKAHRFMKGLESQNLETQKLVTYLLTGSPSATL